MDAPIFFSYETKRFGRLGNSDLKEYNLNLKLKLRQFSPNISLNSSDETGRSCEQRPIEIDRETDLC